MRLLFCLFLHLHSWSLLFSRPHRLPSSTSLLSSRSDLDLRPPILSLSNPLNFSQPPLYAFHYSLESTFHSLNVLLHFVLSMPRVFLFLMPLEVRTVLCIELNASANECWAWRAVVTETSEQPSFIDSVHIHVNNRPTMLCQACNHWIVQKG